MIAGCGTLQEKRRMNAKKPAATRGTVHAETGKPPVKASKPTAPATKAETVEKVIKARAAAIGIDPKKVFVGVVGAKPDKPAQAAKPAAPAQKPADKPKPEAKPAQAAPAPAPAPKPAAPAETWGEINDRHAREIAALGVTLSPPKGKQRDGVRFVRMLSGLYIDARKVDEYRRTVDRHRAERGALRDNVATARAVYAGALGNSDCDERAALYALGLMFTVAHDGVDLVVPLLRANRALAETWRDALEGVRPGARSVIVTVRALQRKPAPAPAPAPAKPAEAAKPATDAKKPADKPAQKPADKPAQADRPKGLGMIAKIEAKADAKPAKAKAKK